MPRVTHVKRARKPIPSIGVEVGDSYYWWQFAFSKRSVSKTPPKPSQLTRSEFMISLYELQEEQSSLTIEDAEDFASRIREIADECEEKIQNMPESLQYAPSGELLQERSESMNAWADEVEEIFGRFDDEMLEDDVDDLCTELHETEVSL